MSRRASNVGVLLTSMVLGLAGACADDDEARSAGTRDSGAGDGTASGGSGGSGGEGGSGGTGATGGSSATGGSGGGIDGASDATGSGGDAGSSAGGVGGDGGGSSGAGGTSGASGSGGAAGAGGTSGGAPDAGADVSSPDGASPDAAFDAASDVAVEAPPPIDAGPDCIAPVGEQPIAPESAGLVSTGLVLWLRADRGVYKTATDQVCAWIDQSGMGHVFSAILATRPTWIASSVGGEPGIRIAGAGQHLFSASVLGLPAQSARTFVAVQQLSSTTARFNAVGQGASGSAGTYLQIDTNPFNTVGSREGVYAHNNAYDADLATSTAPRVHVYAMDTMTVGTPVLSGIRYRINGTATTLTRTPGGLGNGNFESFATANTTWIGAGASNRDAVVTEVLVYDHALTPTEEATVESALTTRYSL